jgi:hypothetical protein
MKGTSKMKQRIIALLSAVLLVLSIIALSTTGRAQETTTEQPSGGYVLGSILLSVLYVPVKLVTCVGTNTGAAVAYIATYGVEGNYDGGTNGRDIGETARRSCTGDWIITPQQLKNDYGY